ncbi:hypothetical protein EYF80_025039 [Liparis tanakae]|uniref:Uncharacterized protein n=1 Tax=Liparis tanakae TaxID=230148 RepID=A0A4Z2HIG4_9TELE|nr:hypothetical protein EYF80_025039 [Liparis tanakae]
MLVTLQQKRLVGDRAIKGIGGGADLRVHLNEIEKDHIFSLHFDGFVERILRFGLDHLIEFSHDDQQTANEGVCSRGAGGGAGALDRGLGSEHGTAPLCVGQLLLHLHILLPEQGQVLLQLGHLLCHAYRRQEDKMRGCKE